MVKQRSIQISTHGRGFVDITQEVKDFLANTKVSLGLCNVFLHHTSASLTLCENADSTVQKDLEAFISRLIPDGDPLYKHTDEGLDDMPAHVRTVITTNSISIPITENKLALGTWQSIYLWEHRLKGYQRKLTLTIVGE